MSINLKQNIAIIGAGNQALAWAENLKDSNLDFAIGLRVGSPSFSLSSRFTTFSLGKNLKSYDVLILLIPDDQHENFLDKYSQFLTIDTKIIIAHGYSHPKLVENYPHFDYILLAPKSIAHEVRRNYLLDLKTPCAFEFKKSNEKLIRNLAENLGFALISQTSFQEEVQADLFSEQSLLCGLFPHIINECYEIMLKHGIDSNLAFLETFYESKLIMNTLFDHGPQAFFNLISPNAFIGSLKGKETLISKEFKQNLESLFLDVKSKKFEQYLHSKNYSKEKEISHKFWSSTELQKKYNQLKKQKII